MSDTTESKPQEEPTPPVSKSKLILASLPSLISGLLMGASLAVAFTLASMMQEIDGRPDAQLDARFLPLSISFLMVIVVSIILNRIVKRQRKVEEAKTAKEQSVDTAEDEDE